MIDPYDYGFYSKLLNKPFDTLDELKKAEQEFKYEEAKKQEAIDTKKELAKKVEDSYKTYIEVLNESREELKKVQEELDKKVSDSYNEYVEAKNEFIEKYGSFHMTYTNKEPKVDTSSSNLPSVFSTLFEDFFKKF